MTQRDDMMICKLASAKVLRPKCIQATAAKHPRLPPRIQRSDKIGAPFATSVTSSTSVRGHLSLGNHLVKNNAGFARSSMQPISNPAHRPSSIQNYKNPAHTHTYMYMYVYIYIYVYIIIHMSVDQYYCFWKWFLRGLLLSFRGTFALTFAQHV